MLGSSNVIQLVPLKVLSSLPNLRRSQCTSNGLTTPHFKSYMPACAQVHLHNVDVECESENCVGLKLAMVLALLQYCLHTIEPIILKLLSQ